MTEELEDKLNELLGMKKQIDELTAEKKISDDSLLQEYKRQSTISKIFYNIFAGSSTLFVIIGLIMLFISPSVKTQIGSLSTIILAAAIGLGAELKHHETKIKLSILQEMKQLELRLTEILKK